MALCVSDDSADKVASNEDLLTEIFLRLPIRSIFRSKSVSKRWRSVASDLPIHRLLQDRNPNHHHHQPCGLFLEYRGDYTHEYDFVPFHNNNNCSRTDPILVTPPKFTKDSLFGSANSATIIHSCNGLIVGYTDGFAQSSAQIIAQFVTAYFVYNPTTRIIRTLPPIAGAGVPLTGPFNMTLAFNPSKSPHYKVLHIHSITPRRTDCDLMIYSSETGVWKSVTAPLPNPHHYCDLTEFRGGIYWNDALHWIFRRGFVLYFKLDEERFYHVPTHEGWDVLDCQSNSNLFESRGCLLLIDMLDPLDSRVFSIYEMKGDYSGWFVKFVVDLHDLPQFFPSMIKKSANPFAPMKYSFVVHSVVLGGGEGEEGDFDSFIVMEAPGMIIRYDFVSMTFRLLHNVVHPRGYTRPLSARERARTAFQFAESLAGV